MLLYHLTSWSSLMIFLRIVEGPRSLCEAKGKYTLSTSCPEYKALCLCYVVFLILSLTYKTKMHNAMDQPRTLACHALSVKFFFPFYYFLVLQQMNEWMYYVCICVSVILSEYVCFCPWLTFLLSSCFFFLPFYNISVLVRPSLFNTSFIPKTLIMLFREYLYRRNRQNTNRVLTTV